MIFFFKYRCKKWESFILWLVAYMPSDVIRKNTYRMLIFFLKDCTIMNCNQTPCSRCTEKVLFSVNIFSKNVVSRFSPFTLGGISSNQSCHSAVFKNSSYVTILRSFIIHQDWSKFRNLYLKLYNFYTYK